MMNFTFKFNIKLPSDYLIALSVLDTMEYFGIGHCDSGYYEGWDGKGEASEEDCKSLCLNEDQCTYAAYLNDNGTRTCSRYNKVSCNLDTSTQRERGHKTFKKGLLLKNHSVSLTN